MLKKTHIESSKAYREFRALNEQEPRAIMRYYKEHEKVFQELEFDEQNYILTVYADALFKLGSYQSYLKLADRIIEISIIDNVRFIQGEDIYRKTLFQKGYAYFYLHDYTAASYVAKELIKISPSYRPYTRLLQRCMIRQRPNYVKKLLGLGVGFYFLSVIFIIIEQLIIANFYNDVLAIAKLVRMGVFGLGLGAFIVGEGSHHWQIRNFIKDFRSKAKARKNDRA